MVSGPVRPLARPNGREEGGEGGKGGRSGGSLGRVEYVLKEVPITSEGVTDGAEGTQHNGLRRGSSLSVVHLACVRPKAPQGDQAECQGAIPQLLEAL